MRRKNPNEYPCSIGGNIPKTGAATTVKTNNPAPERTDTPNHRNDARARGSAFARRH